MEKIKPMLATLAKEPFDSGDWIYEIKWDGARGIAFIENGKLRLQSRYLNDITSQFPEFADLPKQVRAKQAILDGEIVALDEEGKLSFAGIQNRIHKSKEIQIREAMKRFPAIYIAFDLLDEEGQSLMRIPLMKRKEKLQALLEASAQIRVAKFKEREGIRSFEAAKAQGLEGIMAKRKDSLYLPGRRSKSWQKFKVRQEGDFVIVYYETSTSERRDLFGSLGLAKRTPDGKLLHVGKVASGLTEKVIHFLNRWLPENEIKECPVLNPPEEKGLFWVKPVLECEIRYQEITSGGKLRQASFRRLKGEENF